MRTKPIVPHEAPLEASRYFRAATAAMREHQPLVMLAMLRAGTLLEHLRMAANDAVQMDHDLNQQMTDALPGQIEELVTSEVLVTPMQTEPDADPNPNQLRELERRMRAFETALNDGTTTPTYPSRKNRRLPAAAPA